MRFLTGVSSFGQFFCLFFVDSAVRLSCLAIDYFNSSISMDSLISIRAQICLFLVQQQNTILLRNFNRGKNLFLFLNSLHDPLPCIEKVSSWLLFRENTQNSIWRRRLCTDTWLNTCLKRSPCCLRCQQTAYTRHENNGQMLVLWNRLLFFHFNLLLYSCVGLISWIFRISPPFKKNVFLPPGLPSSPTSFCLPLCLQLPSDEARGTFIKALKHIL